MPAPGLRPLPALSPVGMVLLVEDDQGDAVLVRARLTEAGIDDSAVIWVRTLVDAQRALNQAPSCVILDLGLPDADGLRALDAIVEAAPDTPVVVLTGRHDASGGAALAAGAQDYLVKDDITSDLLDRSIRYAIERKRAQRTRQQLLAARITSAEKARLERGLLPSPLLRTTAAACSTYYQPGRDHAVLGGDFFDVVETADGAVRAIIGDVMGHGPDEAALGVHLRVAWRALVLAGIPQHEGLVRLGEMLMAEAAGSALFATVCDVVLDTTLATATIRVAGHPAPLLCADGVTRYIEVPVGPPLGVGMRDAPGSERWPSTTVPVGFGSSVILYTDGLLDAYAPDGRDSASIGLDEIIDAVTSCAAAGGEVPSWIPRLVSTAPKTSDDDTAVVVLTLQARDS